MTNITFLKDNGGAEDSENAWFFPIFSAILGQNMVEMDNFAPRKNLIRDEIYQ